MSKRNEKKHWTDKLVQLNACCEAVQWAQGYPSLRAAWEACERGDWMLWLAGRTCRTLPQRKRLVLAACACARTALRYVKVGEKRPRAAIRMAERWARGDCSVSLQDVRSAAAYAAADGTHSRPELADSFYRPPQYNDTGGFDRFAEPER